MTVKEYLSQAKFLDQRINSKIQQVAVLNDLATKATSTLTGMPHNPNHATSTMEETIAKIIDLQAEINRDIDRFEEGAVRHHQGGRRHRVPDHSGEAVPVLP